MHKEFTNIYGANHNFAIPAWTLNANSKVSEQYHSMGHPMDRAPPGLKTDRDHLIKDNLGHYCPKIFETKRERKKSGTAGNRIKRGGCRSSVAAHWRLKPEALGTIPRGTIFLSFPLPNQRSSDSNSTDYLSLDDLYRSSDLEEPCPSGSPCCDIAQILSNSRHKHSNYHLSNMNTKWRQ